MPRKSKKSSKEAQRTWFDVLNKEEVRAKIAIVVVFVVLFFFSIYTFKTEASVTEFYFNSCLGKWRNAENAEGKPSVALESTQENYHLGNSAVLYSDLTEIFCGGLDEEIPEGRNLEKTRLKIAIAFSSDPLREAPDPSEVIDDNEELIEGEELIDVTDQNEATSTDSATEIPDASGANENSDSVDTPSEAPTNSQTEETPSSENEIDASSETNTDVSVPAIDSGAQEAATSFRLINVARAEEVAETPAEIPAENQNTEASVDEPVSENENPTVSEGEAGETEPTDEAEVVTETQTEEPEVAEVFLEIYYTLDGGKTLNILDKVTASNWQNKSFEYDVPITTWEDLSKFQVSLHGVSVVENQPIVYLDSAWLITEHKPESEEETDEVELDEGVQSGLYSEVVKTPNFDSDKSQDYPEAEVSAVICDISPFSQKIKAGDSARYQVGLSEKLNPYRLTFGKLPEGISIATEEVGEEVFFVIEAESSAEEGSTNISVLYEVINDDAVVEENTCQFNVVIQ